jgi:hypothetical protein
MNGGLERMWKKAVLVCSDVLFRHLPGGGAEGKHEASVRVVIVADLLLAVLNS